PTVTFKAFLSHHVPCATFMAFLSTGDGDIPVRAQGSNITPTKMNILPITKSNRRLQVRLRRTGFDPLL
ncbi:MAG: hypothetical protein KC592_18450, partial [Nitrospira sp.]|nr:hypothetical protein [Nitrospira sp.]